MIRLVDEGGSELESRLVYRVYSHSWLDVILITAELTTTPIMPAAGTRTLAKLLIMHISTIQQDQ
jgi:hypothetical protein